MTQTILQDTTWTGVIDLDGTVQVAEGATLTISKGSTVNGGRIEVWGSLVVDGQAETLVNINDTQIVFGSKSYSTSAAIDIHSAHIKGGSFLNGGWEYGTVSLTDSMVEDWSSQVFINQPHSDSTIARNIFKNIYGFRINTASSNETVSFKNNLFYDIDSTNFESHYYNSFPLINVQNAYGNTLGNSVAVETIIINENSFMNTGRVALELMENGSTFPKVNAQSNWFNTTNMLEISARVLDRSDGLTYPSIIDIGGALSAADPNTPAVDNIPTYDTRVDTTGNTVILQDTTWTGVIDLDGTVQVAEGATLTISKGSTVNGGRIEVWGSLVVDGQAETLVNINDTQIVFGSKSYSTSAAIDIHSAHIKGGSFLNGGWEYGTVSLTDSMVEDWSSQVFINQPHSDSTIARNIFKNIYGFRINTASSNETVSFKNNLFYDIDSTNFESHYYNSFPLINVQNAYGNTLGNSVAVETIIINENSFMNTGRVALELMENGSTFPKVNAQSNWFNTTNMLEISARVLDRSDGLTYPSIIDIGGALSAADPNTPTVYFPNMKTVTLGSSFDTATDVGSLKALDEVWLDLTINSGSKGFLKVNPDLDFQNFDRLFFYIDSKNIGIRTYKNDGTLIGTFPPLEFKPGVGVDPEIESFFLPYNVAIFKHDNQILGQEPAYDSSAAVYEFYHKNDQPFSSYPMTFKTVVEHFDVIDLSTPTGTINDLGKYDGTVFGVDGGIGNWSHPTDWAGQSFPSGTKIYKDMSFYSISNKDGIKISVSKDSPIILFLENNSTVDGHISEIFGYNLFADKQQSTLGLDFFSQSDGHLFSTQNHHHDWANPLVYIGTEDGKGNKVFNLKNDYGNLQIVGPYNNVSGNSRFINKDYILQITSKSSTPVEGWLEIHRNYNYDNFKGNMNYLEYESFGGGYYSHSNVSLYGQIIIEQNRKSSLIEWQPSASNNSTVKSLNTLTVNPYLGNDVLKIKDPIENFNLIYKDDSYPQESLEIKYHSDQQKFLVTGETFTDWIDLSDSKASIKNWKITAGGQLEETKPITIYGYDKSTENFVAEIHSNPEKWASDRTSDKFHGTTSTTDKLVVKAITNQTNNPAIKISSNDDGAGTVKTTLSNGLEKTIVDFTKTDVFETGDGNDTVSVSHSNSAIYSGGGNDNISSGAASHFISTGSGDDSITIEGKDYWGLDYEAWNVGFQDIKYYKIPIDGKLKHEQVFNGGSGSDTLNASSASETIFRHDGFSGSYQGENKLNRVDLIEIINAGAGDDVIDMTTPNENINYTLNMTLNGETGNDVLWAGPGNDIITGGEGDDILFGGKGDDTLTGGNGRDIFEFIAGSGNDVIKDYTSEDILRFFLHDGDTTNLTISNANTLSWETVNGIETIKFEGLFLPTFDGLTTNFIQPAEDSKSIYVLYDEVDGWSTANLVGTEEADFFVGGSGIDKIMGGAGSDTIDGYGGADIIYSGYNDDYVYGGSGDDRLNTGKGNDKVYGGAGIDTIYAGDGKDKLYGNEGADILVGGFGADTIITGTGADLIKISAGESPAAYASGYPSTSAHDLIGDFTTGASEDRFSYETAFSIVQSETTTPSKGSAAISSQGIATFAADDDTLSEKIYAVNSGINTGIEKAGAVAAFQHGSNAFLFIHDGFTALGVADSLIRLEDLDLTSKSLNINNDLLTIV